MAFGAFQISGFQRNAFQIVTSIAPIPVVKSKGGYKKERTHNKSFKQTVKESLEELLGEPKVIEQVKEIVSEFSNSTKPTISSIDLRMLSQNVEIAQRIINMAMEMQREREDEEAILLLM
jgi:hypothetical protein